MAVSPIDPGMTAGEILRRYPRTLEVFDRYGVVFCAGCYLTLFDPLEAVVGYHAVRDVDAFLTDLARAAADGTGARPAWAGPAPTDDPRLAHGALGPEVERRVQARMAEDALAAALGIRLLGVRRGSARAGAAVRDGEACHPALFAALALFAAQAADLGLDAGGSRLVDLSLAPLDLSLAGHFVVADAQREGAPAATGERAYRVRVLGHGDRTVGVATVLLGRDAAGDGA